VRKALEEARDDDLEAAVETLAERFPQALAALRGMSAPADPAWARLAARVAFRAGEMSEAAAYADQAITLDEDAATWHLLGRLRLWLHRGDADDAFRRAERLDPRRFVIPYRVKHRRFVRMAELALAGIPERFQDALANTMIVVDDLPTLEAVREGEDPDLLGVYEGATAIEHGLPERIVLYQRNHENVCADADNLQREVAETMRHEIGHHFGMAEDDLPY
jgi:predicted Zn-dependent protease with MMP-like domain